MPTSYDDAIADYDAATERLLLSRWQDRDEQRRALNDALGSLYRLRNRAHAAAGGHDAYFEIVEGSVPGQVVEAIALVRGAGEHDFMRDVEPRARHVFLGPTTFPSPDLYADDRNLFWRSRGDLGYDLAARESKKYREAKERYYDEQLAGELVVHTLRRARLFFAPGSSTPSTPQEWWPPLPVSDPERTLPQ